MDFREKLKAYTSEQLWEEYCGFLNMNIKDYMFVQERLMKEQIKLFSESGLGKRMFGDRKFEDIGEFRRFFPMTKYEDYADVLLAKNADMLPAEPIIWIETTWEGGFRPIKLAPYSREMLDTYKHNVFSIMMLATGKKDGDFNTKSKDRILYGGAPLPYMTGLVPSLLNEEMDYVWLPDENTDPSISFSRRIKNGFKMAFAGGVDYFFGIGSVANYITEHFSDSSDKGGKSGSKMKISPAIALRYLKAKKRHKKDGKKLVPGDVFKLKGLVISGTDGPHYKERLANAWGVVPLEITAGTELTVAGTEDYNRNGMVFFPDACFYEFIPESELVREEEEEGYVPRTCLMDGVKKGGFYELVISVFHGGAFMRYRIGDMYHCVSAEPDGSLPRFTFHDRVKDVIDIAGFTRITEASINEVITRSNLHLHNWLAAKEYDENDTPFLHLYVELDVEDEKNAAVTRELLTEHMALYFKFFDSDYDDLKKLLDMEPLFITVIKKGTIEDCEKRLGRKIRKINPSALDIQSLNERKIDYIPSILNRVGD